jgi:hypothetical protein
MKPLDRIFLLFTALLASYQVVQGIDGLSSMAIANYTIGFGVMVIASLMMIILGFEILDSPLVIVASSLIPLSMGLGLITEFYPDYRLPYGVFTVIGFIAILITRVRGPKQLAVLVLAITHGIAGLTIFFLPLYLAIRNIAPGGFAWVGIGGMLIGLGGLLLSFLKSGKPILSRERILSIFPGLLMLTTLTFVIGFRFI